MTTATVKPLVSAKETILGATLALEQRFPITPRNDQGTTLNTKYGVQASRAPVNPRLVQYFCWGNGGRSNDTTTLSSAQYALGTNMALYSPRPFRAVLLSEDLDATTRANYAMRQVTTINGQQYVLYWLKKLSFTQSQVQYNRTDPTSGVVTTYELDYTNLSPTPPVADDNGVITDVADQISVLVPATVVITGQEVLEAIGVIDGGNQQYSVASELGFVSASAESIAAVDFTGASFSYIEAILAQMVDQYNWIGQPFLSTTDTWNRTIDMTISNSLLS